MTLKNSNTSRRIQMNLDHIEKLWASAEHWLENWQDPITARISSEDCPCCQAYYNDWEDEGCFDCPIFRYTGEHDCHGTPWSEAHDAYRLSGFNPKAVKMTREAFEAEYRFLVELALGELK